MVYFISMSVLELPLQYHQLNLYKPIQFLTVQSVFWRTSGFHHDSNLSLAHAKRLLRHNVENFHQKICPARNFLKVTFNQFPEHFSSTSDAKHSSEIFVSLSIFRCSRINDLYSVLLEKILSKLSPLSSFLAFDNLLRSFCTFTICEGNFFLLANLITFLPPPPPCTQVLYFKVSLWDIPHRSKYFPIQVI